MMEILVFPVPFSVFAFFLPSRGTHGLLSHNAHVPCGSDTAYTYPFYVRLPMSGLQSHYIMVAGRVPLNSRSLLHVAFDLVQTAYSAAITAVSRPCLENLLLLCTPMNSL